MSGPSVVGRSSMHESVTSARVIGEVVAASLWCLIVIAAMVGRSWLGPIEILFLLAPLVLVPLGFRLVQRQVGEYSLVGRAARSVRPFAAILAAASFWPPAGVPRRSRRRLGFWCVDWRRSTAYGGSFNGALDPPRASATL